MMYLYKNGYPTTLLCQSFIRTALLMMKPEKSEKHGIYSIERRYRNTNLAKQIKAYIKKIDSQIPASYPNKDRVALTLQQNINNFLAEHPGASFNDIIEEFGSATEVAASFFDELPEQEISDIMQKKRKILYLSIALCLVCAVIFFAVLKYMNYWANEEALIFTEGLYIYDDPEDASEIQEKILQGEDLPEN